MIVDRRNGITARLKSIIRFVLFLFILVPHLLIAQEKKPVVALVLSGGGAKGIAHIPVVEALDSLGIVPDMVLGTSMGSIIGGLYAMGYTGKTIDSLAKSANWDKLLSNEIALIDVGIEEKSEFKRYLFDFDLVEGKPKFGEALIKDQNLREFLAQITVPGININNFDSLSIPYRAIAADIVNGKEVVIKDGSLYMAMRASMAIPTVFSPVEYDSTLLVDGGVLNNFPADVAKRMGADIIVGSVVSGGMQPKEDLYDMTAILFQTGMLTSNLKNPSNRDLCNILIDHVPHLTYGTGDFSKSNGIYEEGKIATKESLEELVSLKEKLKGFKQRVHQLPRLDHTYSFDSILYSGISEGNMDLLTSRTNIQPDTKYTVKDVVDGVDRAMGTNMFDQIAIKSLDLDEGIGIEFQGHERTPLIFKGGLHYDSDQGVGLLLNVTGRNVLGNASRTLFTADVAEAPKFRLQHQKYFGRHKHWWWRSELFAQQTKQKIYVNGKKADNLRYRFLQFDNQLNKDLNFLSSYIGIGINYELTGVKPEIDPKVSDNAISLEYYQFDHLELSVHYLLNTMREVFYPLKGTFFKARLSRALIHHADLQFSQDTIPDAKGYTNGFTRLGMQFEERIPMGKKISAVVQASLGFTFVDELQSDELSFLNVGFGANYFLGGNWVRARRDNYVFRGLQDSEVVVPQFMMLNLGFQWSPIRKIFLTPHVNVASIGFDGFNEYIKDAISPGGRWSEEIETSGIISAGATASYRSLLGPIDLDISWVNDIDRFRVFLGFGYQFNRSD